MRSGSISLLAAHPPPHCNFAQHFLHFFKERHDRSAATICRVSIKPSSTEPIGKERRLANSGQGKNVPSWCSVIEALPAVQ